MYVLENMKYLHCVLSVSVTCMFVCSCREERKRDEEREREEQRAKDTKEQAQSEQTAGVTQTDGPQVFPTARYGEEILM